MYTPLEMDNITRQETANKQVEILFKFNVVLFSGDVAFLTHFSGNFEQFEVEVYQRQE